MEKLAPQRKQTPNMANEGCRLPRESLESRVEAKPNEYVTLALALTPTGHHIALLQPQPLPESCKNVTSILRVSAEGSSSTELYDSEVARAIPMRSLLHRDIEVSRANSTCLSMDSQTFPTESTFV